MLAGSHLLAGGGGARALELLQVLGLLGKGLLEHLNLALEGGNIGGLSLIHLLEVRQLVDVVVGGTLIRDTSSLLEKPKEDFVVFGYLHDSVLVQKGIVVLFLPQAG